VITVIAIALGVVVILDTFDVPSTVRSRIRVWLRASLDADVEANVETPRWGRAWNSGALSVPTDAASRMHVSGSEDVETRLIRVDGVSRTAVQGSLPHSFDLQVDLPPDAELWLSLNQFLPASVGTAIEYEVRLAEAKTGPPLFRMELPARHTGWKNVSIDLAGAGTGTATLKFRAVLVGDTGVDAPTTAYWGDMSLRSRSADDRPDISVILIDTLRPDHLGVYGYARPTSPYIDELAAGGVRFNRVVSTAPWTDPAILSLMTGLYPRDLWEPARHKLTIKKRLPDSVATLSETLSRSGYHTLAASDHPGVRAERFGRGFDVFANLYYRRGEPGGWRKTEEGRLLDRLERVLAERGTGPVFSYIHILYPHRPLEAPPGYLEAVGGSLEGIDPDGMAAELERYDAEIRVADDMVREIHAMQVAAGWDEDAIVIVVSDHGEGFGEHAHEEHGNSLYNELLHVPLILFGPGRLPAGRTVETQVRLVDLFPTLVELAGAPAVSGVRGESLLPLLESDGASRIAYSEFPHTRITDAYAIQSDRLKGVFGDPEFGDEGWFMLDSDPGERRVLRSRPEGADFLVEQAEKIRTSPTLSGVGEARPLGDETMEKLRTLGYME
jgi:arylsulfatase A-like enzyme